METELIVEARMAGVMAPNLTPFNHDLTVAEDLFVKHAEWLIGTGCAALVPFGTTGEALSLGQEERMRLLECLVAAGLDPARLLPGTGLCNLPDTVTLSQHALDLGCPGVMVLPPFYYKNLSDDGLFAYFSALIDKIDRPQLRIYLYHIPPVAVIGFGHELIDRLRRAFPQTIVGIKDSSGDWKNTEAILRAAPGFEVFPGSEIPLLDALRLGAAGCITATGNINARAIRELYTSWQSEDAEDRQHRLRAFREIVQGYSPIPAMKWLLARHWGDDRWKNVRPPLMPLPEPEGRALAEKLSQEFGFRL